MSSPKVLFVHLLLVFLTIGLAGNACPARAQDERSELIAVINALRADHGLEPYTVDAGLMQMAQEHSEYQASIHKSTHQHSDGRNPPQLGVVENVAGGDFGFLDPHTAVYKIWQDWGHMQTMIGYPAGAMGVGIASDEDTIYYTLEVRPLKETGTKQPTQSAATVEALLTPIPIQPLETVTPRPDGMVIHLVGYGQTLWSIAVAYGVTVDQIRAWNNIAPDSTDIYAGQRLLVRLPGEPLPPAPTTAPALASALPAVDPTRLLAAASPSPGIDPSPSAAASGESTLGRTPLPVTGALTPGPATPPPGGSQVVIVAGAIIAAGLALLLVLLLPGKHR